MIIVAALVVVGSVIAIPVTTRMVANAKNDSALVMTATFFESARNRAVSERRNEELSFPTSSTMRLERIEEPSKLRTVVAELQLEGEAEFVRDESLPTNPADTPDKFGGLEAINYSTGSGPVMFTSDGSLIDAAGDVTNATFYIAKPDHPETARAITITGVTGLVRAWKWGGSAWMH